MHMAGGGDWVGVVVVLPPTVRCCAVLSLDVAPLDVLLRVSARGAQWVGDGRGCNVSGGKGCTGSSGR